MIGDKYKVKQDCQTGRFRLKQGDILTENGAYNFETEVYEDGGVYNNLLNDEQEFICEVGSKFAFDNLEKNVNGLTIQ